MRNALPCAAAVFAIILSACTHNTANIRTFASNVKVVTGDTPDIVLADQANCEQNSALQDEFKTLVPEAARITPLPCADLEKVGASVLIETKALAAYADALNSVAQDQFVTTDADGASLTSALQTGNVVGGPAAEAVGALFSAVETAALSGYRQRELKKVMTGEPAKAFKTVIQSYMALVNQYSGAIDRRVSDIELMKNALRRQERLRETDKKLPPEPVAVAEMLIRLTAIQLDLNTKQAAVKDFSDAVTKLTPAFDAAARDLNHPKPSEIYADVKAFASQVKDAHDKLKKAFG